MTHLLAFIAFLGLLLSLAAHVSALFGIDISAKVPLVWSLHVGIFVVFIPFVILSRKTLGARPALAELRKQFPTWVIAMGAAIFGYAIINFLLFIVATQGGNPAIRDGRFILQEHGRLIRELTATEYSSLKANEVRGFSGHWLVFYFVPFAYFMFRKKT